MFLTKSIIFVSRLFNYNSVWSNVILRMQVFNFFNFLQDILNYRRILLYSSPYRKTKFHSPNGKRAGFLKFPVCFETETYLFLKVFRQAVFFFFSPIFHPNNNIASYAASIIENRAVHILAYEHFFLPLSSSLFCNGQSNELIIHLSPEPFVFSCKGSAG